MRRKDKAVSDYENILKIIRSCQVCRLALSQDNKPYLVPVCFGYDGTSIFFHTALKGKKIDIISVNNNVCFEFETHVAVIADETAPCDWSCSFQSVIGFGTVHELTTKDKKIEGLTHIMGQYSEKNWDFENISLSGVKVWKITIDSMTAKQSSDHLETA